LLRERRLPLRRKIVRKRNLGLALAFALVFAGACGDDSATDDGAAVTTTEGGISDVPEGSEFCTAYTEMLAGEPTPEQIREVAEVAPEGAVEPLETIAAGAEEDPEGFFDTEEFGTAFAELGAVVNDECADEVITVTAVDYAFQGIPSEVDTGALGVEFANEGEEFHELVLFRKNDDVDQSFDEILELDEEEAGELMSEAGGTFAGPGEDSTALFDLSEPGEYVAVCFVPVGATPDNEEADGPPHFTEGMKTEFTVG
jgi:hypothetical protein